MSRIGIKGLLLVFPFCVWAQAVSWKLIWTANDEADIWYYEIYRDTVPDPRIQIATVIHPETVYVDRNIQKGVLYFYRMRAVDSSYTKSAFSTTVSAAVPRLVNWPERVVMPPDTTIGFDLDNRVRDPDDAFDRLNWSFSGNRLLVLELDDQRRRLKVRSPVDWSGWETVQCRVSDPHGFSDQMEITFTAGDTASSAAEPVNVYPIPFVIGPHGTVAGITFENLPLNGTLSIFNLLGEPVFRTRIIDRTFLWDVRNSRGRAVQSGLYIYVVKDDRGRRIDSKKLVIIR